MNLAVSILGILTMGGWILHHAIPPDVPAATLRMSVGEIPKGSFMFVQAFANDACERHPDGVRLAFFGTRRLQGKSDPHDGVERRVRAGQPIVVSYIFQAGAPGFTETLECRNTVSFVPQVNASYRLHYEMEPGHCTVSVGRLDGAGPKAVDGLRSVDPGCEDGLRG